jgi:hypothetical protein
MDAQERMLLRRQRISLTNIFSEKAGQDQIRDFLEGGIINQYCDDKEGCIRDTCTIIQ